MLFEIILKVIFVYFLILFVLRMMGKREIGQVSLFDFAILLVIADILVTGIDEDYTMLLNYSISIIVLAIIQKVLSYIILKSKRLRNFVDGKESVIIYDGVVNTKEMKKQNYNFDDLITQVRLNNISSLSEIKYLILESNGNISIYKYSDNPINPLPLIVSGRIETKNLSYHNVSEKWIIKKIGDTLIKDIMYANIVDGKLFFVTISGKNHYV